MALQHDRIEEELLCAAVIFDGLVHEAAVISSHQITNLPFVTVLVFLPGGVLEEFVQQREDFGF